MSSRAAVNIVAEYLTMASNWGWSCPEIQAFVRKTALGSVGFADEFLRRDPPYPLSRIVPH